MEVLIYNDIDYSKVKKQFDKTVEFLRNENFDSAEIKKLSHNGYYRAKLDYENRLLFKFAHHNNKNYILLLETILNHDYDKSRFLRGATIDESKLVPFPDSKQLPTEDIQLLPYVNPKIASFHILDKILSFDHDQQEIFHLPTPLIIIGSAGSGKTVLTLEKIKTLRGNILYITLSSFLAEHSAKLYYSFNYNNENQEIDFLSFREFIETLRIPQGKEIDFKAFENWFIRLLDTTKIKDTYKLYEEFKGVITGSSIDCECLTREEYLQRGVKQSIFLAEMREQVYDLFEKYLKFLKENNYYNLNIVSHQWLPFCKPKYDFIIVDEVQDITNIQLYLILKSLKKPTNFILCGDSNQMVYPNFFSWSNIKTMFYKGGMWGDVIRILNTNYRNSVQVTQLANTLLKIKNQRFGSIDKESTYLVEAISSKTGEVVFLEDNNKIKHEFNQKTKNSTRFAVLVMRNEDKPEVRKFFNTPLIFSIQEAKGLEYDNIIMINFISNCDKEFREIISGIDQTDIDEDDIIFSRARDKTDKSLDAYKFYINSLYVAITRSIQNLYIIEKNQKHKILSLLGLITSKKQLNIETQTSSIEDWKKEAHKLEIQGKTEQAELIRETILGTKTPSWKPITRKTLELLKKDALNPERFNKKAKDKLFAYSLIYNDIEIKDKLSELKYRKADGFEDERSSVYRRYYQDYKNEDVRKIKEQVNLYGVNFRNEFNMTPLMIAVHNGAVNIIKYLLELGADTTLIDNNGKNALQIALNLSCFSKEYTKNKLGKVYYFILTDNIKVKVDNQLIKIDNHKIEYFFLNYLIALQESLIKQRRHLEEHGIKADDFINTITEYPDTVLPEYRKKRPYLSSIFAKNELSKQGPYNKKLFLRLARGYYVLNPNLELFVKDKWINVYDLTGTEKMTLEKNIELVDKRREKYWEAEREKHPEYFRDFDKFSKIADKQTDDEPVEDKQVETNEVENKEVYKQLKLFD
ncbi:MAG: ankyrin repeat domain-containing protein [Bacteroidota bacterium]